MKLKYVHKLHGVMILWAAWLYLHSKSKYVLQFKHVTLWGHKPTCCVLWQYHSLTPRRYNPCRVLADSRRRLQPSLSLALLL